MLSLTHRKDDVPSRMAVMAWEHAEVSTPVAMDMTSACLCGSRLPLQVRLGLKSRTRPVVEGRWCCSEACLKARVAAYVRRSGTPLRTPRQEHQHRVPLGLLLLSQGAISQEQLRMARQLCERTGERIEDVLVQRCGLSQQELVQALALQWGCSAWDVKGSMPHGMACVAPHVLLRATGMLPLRMRGDGTIDVAFADAPDATAILALRRIHERHVETGIASGVDVATAMQHVMRQESVPVQEHVCSDDEEVVHLLVKTIQRLAPVECRWARVHSMFWVRMWLEPVALAGGIGQTEDVVDLVVHQPTGKPSKLKPL